MIIVSACLVGINCKYDGGNNLDPRVRDLVARGVAIPVCPEQLGGDPTPRDPVELAGSSGEDVINGNGSPKSLSGMDKNNSFIKGANEVLNLAKLVGARFAILKERSPSCGSAIIYDGTFTGQKRPGRGVTTALLEQNDIKVYSEENLEEILKIIS